MSLHIVDIHGEIEGDYDIIAELPKNATNSEVLATMLAAIFSEADMRKLGSDSYEEARLWFNEPYKGR